MTQKEQDSKEMFDYLGFDQMCDFLSNRDTKKDGEKMKQALIKIDKNISDGYYESDEFRKYKNRKR